MERMLCEILSHAGLVKVTPAGSNDTDMRSMQLLTAVSSSAVSGSAHSNGVSASVSRLTKSEVRQR